MGSALKVVSSWVLQCVAIFLPDYYYINVLTTTGPIGKYIPRVLYIHIIYIYNRETACWYKMIECNISKNHWRPVRPEGVRSWTNCWPRQQDASAYTVTDYVKDRGYLLWWLMTVKAIDRRNLNFHTRKIHDLLFQYDHQYLKGKRSRRGD